MRYIGTHQNEIKHGICSEGWRCATILNFNTKSDLGIIAIKRNGFINADLRFNPWTVRGKKLLFWAAADLVDTTLR
jgi:hypothetical protein